MATAFAQDSADAAKGQWRKVADQLRPKLLPKLSAFHGRGRDRRPRLYELPGRSLVEAPFHQRPRTAQQRGQTPNRRRRHLSQRGDAIVRLVGAILLEQNDEWAVQRARYMTLETMAALSDDPLVGLPAMVI